MCELFAMSSHFPATVNLSLDELARHGGATGPHTDGWGIAYYEGYDVRRIRETERAADSPWVAFVEKTGLTSTRVIAHIRLATRGERALHNTQPFTRELGGRVHTFAHNGDLPKVQGDASLALGRHRPIGNSDSEHAFCALLASLDELWSEPSRPPPLALRLGKVADFAARLRPHGPANFIYSDGDYLFAHGHRRTQKDRSIRPPGLHWLRRCCDASAVEIAGLKLQSSHAEQHAVLVASVPLTTEAWSPLEEGEILVLADGNEVARHNPATGLRLCPD